MSSPQTLDLEALLAPIPGENPAGKDVRYDGIYDAIREARRADDPDAPQGEWVHERKIADWPAVITLAGESLRAKSKDLQVAAWLVEALVKRHGFPGLRDGLHMLWELQERFWSSLYPEIEDGDVEGRVLLLEWLNTNLPLSIRAVPTVQTSDGQSYAWQHWKESRDVDNLGRQNPGAQAEALAEGKITGEQFDKAVAATSRAFGERLFADLYQCWEEYQQLDRVLEEKLGRDAPSLLDVKKALEDCRTLLDSIVKKKRELEPDPTPVGLEESVTGNGVASEPSDGEAVLPPVGPMRGSPVLLHPGSVPLQPQDRADALRRLAAVAEYFRRTEPHSPVAYLIERAVRWGQMPLDAWLQDVISDDSVLAHLRETLGLKGPEESN